MNSRKPLWLDWDLNWSFGIINTQEFKKLLLEYFVCWINQDSASFLTDSDNKAHEMVEEEAEAALESIKGLDAADQWLLTTFPNVQYLEDVDRKLELKRSTFDGWLACYALILKYIPISGGLLISFIFSSLLDFRPQILGTKLFSCFSNILHKINIHICTQEQRKYFPRNFHPKEGENQGSIEDTTWKLKKKSNLLLLSTLKRSFRRWYHSVRRNSSVSLGEASEKKRWPCSLKCLHWSKKK